MPLTLKDMERDTTAEVLADPSRQVKDTTTVAPEFVPAPPAPVEAEAPAAVVPPVEEKPADKPMEEAAKPPEPVPTPAPVETKAPEPPVLLANKFKSPQELEKAYLELEKGFTRKAQEAAAAAAQVPQAATPEATEEARLKMINDFLTDPEATVRSIEQRVSERTQAAQAINAKVSAWREVNKDLQPYERFVAAELQALTSADPNLDPLAALEQATISIRSIVGAIRTEGSKEALSVQQSVTPIAAVKVNTPPPSGEQPPKAPMTEKEILDDHLAMLTAEAKRVRRPVR